MLSTTANHSPTKLKLPDIDVRIARLEAYEKWRTPIRIDYEAVLGKESWDRHMKHLENIIAIMAKAETSALLLRVQIQENLQRGGEPFVPALPWAAAELIR